MRMPPSATPESNVIYSYDTGALVVDGATWRVAGLSGAPSFSGKENPERFWG